MSIEVSNLSFSHCTRNVLTDVSFSAENGKLIAVLGPNGVGKTTLFRCILGLQRKYKGTILVDGINAKELSAKELAYHIAYIPQTHRQLFGYSVLDMVLMGTTHSLSSISVPGKAETEKAIKALDRLGIADFSQRNFAHLSGGEQQLVLIARALAQQSRTLLLDEPTSSLDYGNQIDFHSILCDLSKDGYSIIFSTHNPQHALWYADSVLALSEGKVAAFGDPGKVIDSALMEKLFHVKSSLLRTENGPMIVPSLSKRT